MVNLEGFESVICGRDNFGMIVKTVLNKTRNGYVAESKVTVEMLKPENVPEEEKTRQRGLFLRKIKTILNVGRHVNVVKLVGVALDGAAVFFSLLIEKERKMLKREKRKKKKKVDEKVF